MILGKTLIGLLNRRLILNVISSLLAFSLAIIFIRQMIDGYEKGSWNLTELLINYEAGFIRRGLFGQVVMEIYRFLGASPYYLILTVCAGSFLIFSAFISYQARVNKIPLIILPSAYLLGGPVMNDFWMRKDVFLVLCFILILYLLRNPLKWTVYLPINLVTIIATLCHETFGFWALGVFLLIIPLIMADRTNHALKIKHFIATFAWFIPSIIVFCSCIIFKGNLDMATNIWNSWDEVQFPKTGPLDMYPPTAINSLSWTLYQGVSLSFYLLFKFSHGIYIPLGIVFTIVSVYFMISNVPYLKSFYGDQGSDLTAVRTDSEILSKWLIIQLVLISPLFVLGWDYGRWIFIWVSTSLCLFMVLPTEINLAMTRLSVWNFISNSGRFLRIRPAMMALTNEMRNWLLALCYLITGVSATGWDLITFLITSPPGILFQSAYFLLHGFLFKYLAV